MITIKERIDTTLIYMWFINVIIVCGCAFNAALCLFRLNNEEVGRILLTISSCLGFITVAELTINIGILPLIKVIYKAIDKRRHPENYIPVTKEKLAQDFRDLADAILNDNEPTKEDKTNG